MGKGFLAVRGTWLVVLSGGALACSSSSAVTGNLDFDAGPGGVGAGGSGAGGGGGAGGSSNDGGEPGDAAGDVVIPPGGSVGSTCSGTMPCRMGLACSGTNVCEPGGMLPPGTPCVLNAECSAGNVCNWIGNARVCGPAGIGMLGATCQSNSDCAKGFRCSLSGFGAKCTPDGTVDVGGACKTSSECFGGLACLGGKCEVPPPGVPPFGLPTWPGATCEADTGAAISYFRVPRGAGDKDFYRLPFPNDIRTKNGHPDLTGHPTPGSELLGFDPVDRYLRAIEADNDGFSPYSTVFFRFNTQFDLPDPKVKLAVTYADVTQGPDYGTAAGNGGMWWLIDYGRNGYICPNYLAVRTLDGYTLKSGHTYAVLLHDITVHGNGGPVAPDPEFSAMLAAAPPADAALTSAYATYKPVRDYIAAKSIAAGAIVNATVFTVGHPEKEIANIQAVAQGLAAPTATGWIKCGTSGATSPCPDATGDRGCGTTSDPAFDELQAVVSLPIFQAGTPPYLDVADGHIDQGAPKVARNENVCMSLTVPKGVPMPANGWPVVIYAHGTGGSFRSHIQEGIASALAQVAGDNTVPFAVLGIDQVQHGPRRGMSTDSPENLFYNFANPHAARDNAMQGAIDQMSLARFAASFDILLAGGPVKLDPAAVLFWGHSQGATEGGISAPYISQLGGVVFSGQGASLIDALLTKTKPVNIAGAMAFALSDLTYADPATLKVRGDIFHPVLSLLQTYLDPSDPLNHAAAMTPAMMGGHHVFQAYGQNDSYAPGVTQLTYAIAARLGVAAHDPKITTPEFTCPPNCLPSFATETAGPLSKNVNGRLTAVVRQYAQPMGADGGVTYDGHFVAYHNPLAVRDVYHFLDDLAKGMAPTVAPP